MKNKRSGVFQRGFEEMAERVVDDVNRDTAMDAFAIAEHMAEREGCRFYAFTKGAGAVFVKRESECTREERDNALAYFDPIT